MIHLVNVNQEGPRPCPISCLTAPAMTGWPCGEYKNRCRFCITTHLQKYLDDFMKFCIKVSKSVNTRNNQ